MASVTREPISNLHDRISVKIDKGDYLPDFEKDIRTYSKKANIPGFRKGMVPAGMIKKMYGQDFYRDSVIKSVEKELQKYLTEEKLEIFGQPLPSATEKFPELNMQQPQEYEFLFEVGLKPDIKIDFIGAKKPFQYKIKVKPEDISNRVDSLQAQYGELKETGEVTTENNIVKLNIAETDAEGNLAEGGFGGEQSLYVKVFNEAFQKELMGKKKDDVLKGKLNEIIDTTKYSGVLESLSIDPKDNEKATAPVEIKIVSVNDLEKHPLNEELYNKAFPNRGIKEEAEFKDAIEADEQKQWNEVSEHQLEHSLYHVLMDTPFDLPEVFLKKLLENSETKKTSAEIEAEIPSFIREIKWSLITQQIIKDHELKVNIDEIKAEIKKELGKYFGNVDLDSPEYSWAEGYVDRMMTDKEQLESRYNKLMTQKIFDWAKQQIVPEEKEISQEDFQKLQEEHRHEH